MSDVTRQTPGYLDIEASTTPLHRLGAMIARMLAPESGPSSPARRVEVEFQVPPGTQLQVELEDDVLTIRGVVLTIRGADRVTAPEPQKYYY